MCLYVVSLLGCQQDNISTPSARASQASDTYLLETKASMATQACNPMCSGTESGLDIYSSVDRIIQPVCERGVGEAKMGRGGWRVNSGAHMPTDLDPNSTSHLAVS